MKAILPIALLVMLGQGQASPQAPQAPPLPPATAALEGIAVMQTNGQPLSKVMIDLRGPGSNSTTTEEDGKFYFPSVTPGQYHLYARREGYALSEFGQRWAGGPGQLITLTAGQPAVNVQLGLTPTAAISGRITDRNGLPVAGARVRAMKSTVRENRRTLNVFQEAITNELGEYRLFWLAPGRYYVSAIVLAWQVNSQIILDSDATNSGLNASRTVSRPETTKPLGPGAAADDEIYVPVYYPRTERGEEASAIDLQPGMDYRGADISVAPVHTYHVRGRITNLPLPNPSNTPQRAGNAGPAGGGGAGGGGGGGAPGAGGAAPGGQAAGPTAPPIQVRLAPVDSLGAGYSAQANGSTGNFDFPKVVPGAYILYTFIDGTTTRMPVEVRNGDMDGVTMPLTEGVSLPVRMTLEGEPPPNMPSLSNLYVMLYRDPTIIDAPSMRPPPNGSSDMIPNLSPGDYRVYVPQLLNPMRGTAPTAPPSQWQNIYVKSIRLGDVEVLNAGLKYSPHPDAVLEVVLGANPGTLDGRVLNDRQQAVPSAAVIMFAESPAARIMRTDMFRVTSTDTSGKFQVKGLAPGDYKVFAWEGLDKDAWLDPDFSQFETRGQVIHIEEGKTQGIDLPVISPVR